MAEENKTAEAFLIAAEGLRMSAIKLKEERKRVRDDFNDPKYAAILDSLLESEPTSTRELIDEFGKDIKTTIVEQSQSTSRRVALYCFRLAIFLATVALLIGISLLLARLSGGSRQDTSSGGLLYLSIGLLIVASAAAAAVIIVAFLHSITNFNTFWSQVERVLQSGVFYFFAGLALLVSAIYATNTHEHPSLTFLIAMLGVAIMLFGTGSQAAGSIASSGAPLPSPSDAVVSSRNPGTAPRDGADGGTPVQGDPGRKSNANPGPGPAGEVVAAASDGPSRVRDAVSDWSPVKANAAVAGGAAVLTALFAWGVIHYRSDIRNVFSDSDDYARLQIDTCASRQSDCSDVQGNEERLGTPEQAFKLEDYSIQAELGDGTPLYVRAVNRKLTVLLFSRDIQDNARVRLTATRTSDCGTVYRNKLDVSFRVDNLFKPEKTATSGEDNTPTAVRNDCVAAVGMKSCPLHKFKKEANNRDRTSFYALTFLSDVTDKDSSPVCEKQRENAAKIATAEKMIAGTKSGRPMSPGSLPDIPATTVSKDDIELR